MPITIRLSAVPADSEAAVTRLTATGDPPATGDIAVAVREPGVGLAAVPGLPEAAAGLAGDAALTGRAGELAEVAVPVAGAGTAAAAGRFRRVLLVGAGDGSPSQLRLAGAALGRRVAPGRRTGAGRRILTAMVHGQSAAATRAFTEGVLLGSYQFTAGASEREPGEVQLLVDASQQEAAGRGVIAAEAVALARDLANTPSDRKTPAWLAAEAARIAAGRGLTARSWESGELAAAGFGGLLAVGAGSPNPPTLIELSYVPAEWSRHVVLVGKGVTFDSGGLSLKPTDGMTLMKTDMAGGAAVIACMSALSALGAGVRVTGLIPTAENMPSGSAVRPSDVVTHVGGRTTEVLNTDAEGRLILADALAYAATVLRPDVIVDIATLTGAVKIALGMTVGALYASEEGLARELLAAGEASGEPLWPMPIVESYGDAFDSPIADRANVSYSDQLRPGSVDAAYYLREFTGGCPWAHLDVAGAARATSVQGERAKGATGFGTRLLLRWLTGN